MIECDVLFGHQLVSSECHFQHSLGVVCVFFSCVIVLLACIFLCMISSSPCWKPVRVAAVSRMMADGKGIMKLEPQMTDRNQNGRVWGGV